MIFPSFSGFGVARRDNAYSCSSQGVGDEQQAVLYHAERHEPFLGIAVAIVCPFDSERVLKDITRRLEADAMIQPIVGGFVIVPLEIVILHELMLSSSFVERPAQNCLDGLDGSVTVESHRRFSYTHLMLIGRRAAALNVRHLSVEPVRALILLPLGLLLRLIRPRA